MNGTHVPTRALPSGDEMPIVGFGTWRLHGDTLYTALDGAIEAGYRHFDTAQAYGNEAAIGEHLAEYDRAEVFLTSKVVGSDLAYDRVIRTCEESIERLGSDYLDLFLIHFPNPAVSLRETLAAMATLHDEGLVRNVGVSNFNAYRLSCALHLTDVPIAVNQLEFHPLYQQSRTVKYCHEHDVIVEAAAPLGRGQVFDDAVITSIAERLGKTNAQVALRWAIERDTIPLPRSSDPAHIRENLDLFSWELDEKARERLDDRSARSPAYSMPTEHWSHETYGIAR